MTRAEEIAARLAEVRGRMADAVARAGRAPDSVRLIAVSKKMPPQDVRAALAAGQRDFGENYAQELRDKRLAIEGEGETEGAPAWEPTTRPRWHYLGPIQRNKVKYLAGQVALIHSLDDADILTEIERRAGAVTSAPRTTGEGARDQAGAAPTVQEVLVQVNVAGETRKGGVPPHRLPFLLDQFAPAPHVTCVGLMLIPPFSAEAAETRRHFARLRDIAERERAVARPNVALSELSMGMSGDFVDAVAEGATLIRVGTAIFGARTTR